MTRSRVPRSPGPMRGENARRSGCKLRTARSAPGSGLPLQLSRCSTNYRLHSGNLPCNRSSPARLDLSSGEYVRPHS